MRLTQDRAPNLRVDQRDEANEEKGNGKPLAIMTLREDQLYTVDKASDGWADFEGKHRNHEGWARFTLYEIIFCIYLLHENNGLVPTCMSSLIPNSLGRRYKLHQLTNRRNRHLEHPCSDDFVLNKPLFKSRILEW